MKDMQLWKPCQNRRWSMMQFSDFEYSMKPSIFNQYGRQTLNDDDDLTNTFSIFLYILKYKIEK